MEANTTVNRIKNHLQWKYDSELEERVRRTQELSYLRIIGSHYFADASTQCLELYRDGYMLGCIMSSQALIEAILKFIAKCNGLEFKKEAEELITDLAAKNILNETTTSAAQKAWYHRNDFHHLNSCVSAIDLEAKAKECVDATCIIENEIFGISISEGTISPLYPIYWDTQSKQTITVHLRQLDV